MGEADFNHSKRLGNQLVVAAEKISREVKLAPTQKKVMSTDMKEQSRLAHKMVDDVHLSNTKIGGTLLRYNMGNPMSSLVQVPFLPERSRKNTPAKCLRGTKPVNFL